ncbi:BppU family phage baseplate upper protein [Peribacillus frigoritolerans]|uniref:BppU family phage baseplate upper protein n=1 Tax=Peribacillus frigoritolerans TaxID=450367 RepID=UPI00345D47F8
MSISPPYSPELQNHLTGKHLLALEIPFSQEILTEHLKNGYVSETYGVQSGNGSYHCVRCGNIDQTLFYTFPCKICNQDCTYCRSCIMMGRVSECAKLYRWTGPNISVNSNDLNTLKLSITINQFNKPIDLTGATVRIAIVKPDNKTVFQDCTTTDPTTGSCEVVLNSQAFIISGVYIAEIMIYYGADKVVVTGRFSYSVTKGILDNSTVESTNDWQAITQAIDVAEGILIDLRENGTAVDAQARADLETVTTQLVDTEIIGEDSKAWWNPPIQPAMPWGSNGVPSSTSRDPEEFINGLYEPLRQAHPGYITRTMDGLDQSNTYPIWTYELTPKHYTKTIIVSAGTHGNEYTASFGLYRFIYHLVNDWKLYPQLTKIRRNVRIIVKPINNPWSFKNIERQNKNGVDINRNMDSYWNNITGSSYQVGGTYYKGTAPFSEKESQYLRDCFVKYSEALVYLDFHTINTINAKYINFTPRHKAQFRHIFNDAIQKLWKTGDTIVNGTTAMPTVAVHAALTHDMTTANPEWYNGNYGGTRDSTEMTKALEWFGNIIIKACDIEHKTTQIDETSPFSIIMQYDKLATPTPIIVDKTAYNNVNHATYDLNLKRHGILKVQGKVTFTLSAPATIGVNPIVYQVNHPELGFSDVKDKTFNEELRLLPAGTHTINFDARFPVVPDNHNSATSARPEKVKFRLRMKSSTGATTPVTIDAWRFYLDYVPSEHGTPTKFVDFTGKEALAEGNDFVVVFPDPTKYGIGLYDD